MYRRSLIVALGTLASGCVSESGGFSSTALRLANLSVATETERPDVRYVLEPSAFYSADAVDRERRDTTDPIVVQNVSDIDDAAIREAVETAIGRGEWRSNSTPDGLAALVDRVDFFTGHGTDGTYTHIGLELHELDPDAPPAIEFDATIADGTVTSDSPGTLEFTLRNTSQEAREVFSGTVPPFGVLRADRLGDDESFHLWRDYESEGCVAFTEHGMAVCSIGILTEMAPGETIRRRYEVLHPSTDVHPEYMAPPGPGRYRISGSNSYSTGNGAPGSRLQYEVDFELESV